MSDRSVSVMLKANVSSFVAGIEKAKLATTDLAKAAEKSATTHKQSWDKVGKGMLITGGVLAAGVTLAVKAFMDFDKEMSNVKAVSNASGADMDRLSKAAIKAGADTVFSASEAAKAETELAKAGVKTSDILGGALVGSLNLASAGGLDLADAATISAQAMNIFKLGGSDVSHIADVLAAGANKSAADVGSLGDALKQGGLVAAQTGLHLEDTVGVLSMFADSALVGSDAGTSLKQMLMMLNPQSVKAKDAMAAIGFSAYDASGKFVGMASVAQQLKDGLGGLTAEQRNATLTTIFGSDATRAASILYEQGAAGVRDYTAAVDDNGAAQRMASTMLNNLAGDFEQLKGSIDTALIQSGSAGNDALRSMAQAATGVVNAFGSMPAPLQQSVVKVAALGAVVLVTGGALVMFVPKAIAAKTAINDMGIMAGRSGTMLKGLGVAAGVATIGLPALQAGMDGINSAMGRTAPGADEAGRALTDFYDNGKASGDHADLINRQFSDLGNTVNNVFSTSAGHKISAFFSDAGKSAWYGDGSATTNAIEFFKTIDAGLTQMVGNGNGEKAAAIFKQIASEASNQGYSFAKVQAVLPGYTAALDAAGVANAQAINPVTGLSGAQTQLKSATDAAKKAVDDEVQSLQDAGLAVLSTRSATRDLIDATNAATAAHKKNGDGLSVTTAKGRANQAALDAQSSAALKLADSVFKETGSEAKMRASLVTSRASLIKTYLQFDNNRGRANAYADSILKIPPAKTTKITGDTTKAHANMKALQEEINNLKGKTVAVGVKANFSMGTGGANSMGFFTNAPGGKDGGPVTGGIRGKDSVLRTLMPQEYIVRADGSNLMDAFAYYGGAPGMANGGPVGLLPPPVDTRMNEAARAFLSIVKFKPSALASATGGPGLGGGSGTSGANQALGLAMMLARGWGMGQWPPLRALWTKESGWSARAVNPSSGAYGIPQSLPAEKMRSAGADYLTSAGTQIKWGLGYIAGRYTTPAGAWAHSVATGWYGGGGMVPPGGMALNEPGGKPERMLSGHQTESFDRLVALLSSGSARGGGVRGGTTVNVYPSAGMDERQLAKLVIGELDRTISGGLTGVGVS